MKKGKGFTKYFYTLEDIARTATVDPNTIRQHILRQKLEPDKLDSVVNYILERREKSGAIGI